MSSIVLSAAEVARVREHLSRYGWYRGVFEGFRGRVEELIARAPEIPLAKGRAFYESCPVDHARLSFDPYAPGSHVCPKCGRGWRGEVYDLAWVRQFQDWLGKRLVEAGILYRVEGDERHAGLVRDSLAHFVRHYRDYPLANNLLGPTRLFQSTYLEAFWLVDMVAAYDLTRDSSAYAEADHAGIEGLFYESSEVVRGFDEGVSNRQAFNNAGMGAVALLYDDEELLGHVLSGPHGFAFHMRESLLEDGIWYEGETYHFATLDHSLNLAEMARHRGIDLYRGDSGFGSLRPMFDGPLKVMLPDLTFPSRKDSWYGRGIAYHKEIYELGYARYADERYGGLLAHAYGDGNERQELGWRGFLYLEPELPRTSLAALRPSQSEPMPGTGVAILRADGGTVYASLEYGHYGGGHGHPDRLHLSLHADGVHWLLDPGTGWYHVPELGWYRSTLAHNTIMFDANSQNPAEGKLEAFGTAGGFAAAQATVHGAYPGATLRRSLVLGDGFLLDTFEATGSGEHDIDLICNVRGQLDISGANPHPIAPLAARGGHPFLGRTSELLTAAVDSAGGEGRGQRWNSGAALDATFHDGEARLRVLQQSVDRRFQAEAMGIPLREERRFNTLISRRRGDRACFATVWSWGEDAGASELAAGAVSGVRRAGTEHRLLTDEEPGVAVISRSTGRLSSIAWFNRQAVVADRFRVECDHPLERAALKWDGEQLSAELPAEFGAVRLSGGDLPATAEVSGLPPGAVWNVEGGVLLLRQPAATRVWALPAGRPFSLAAGLENEVRFAVANYGRDGAEPVLELPTGWLAQRMDKVEDRGEVAIWAAAVRVPGDGSSAVVSVVVNDRRLRWPCRIVQPITVDWTIDAGNGESGGAVEGTGEASECGSGGPALVLQVAPAVGMGGRLWGEIHAPWMLTAPRPFALDLARGAKREVRIPLPRLPAPPTAPEPSWRLDHAGVPLPGESSNEGEYHVAALLRFDRFSGVSRARFPLAWCLKRTGPPPGERGIREPGTDRLGGIRLDRPEQVYWAEVPWSGPAGASATAQLTWDESGLYLKCRIRDDEHVSDANHEDLYENDSVQLYFDFRGPSQRDSTFAPGVAAFILAPDASLASVRVEAIAGSRELANRGLSAPWFSSEGVVASAERDEREGGGYLLDAFFPYSSLGISPLRDAAVFRADLSLSDNDGNWYRTHQLVWSGARDDRRCYLRWAYLDPGEYGWVLVVDAETAPGTE